MSEFIIAQNQRSIPLSTRMVNRHGLVAGATGTGKTVTLQVLAESLSRAGVPVFMADVKGDLSGIAAAGAMNPKLSERIAKLGIQAPVFAGSPAVFWDVYGEKGHPVRATVSEMGPLLLSRLMQLNDTQSAVLSLIFRVADDNGLLLLDLKDLRAMTAYAGEHAAELKASYGNVSPASIGSIQRGILYLEEQGAANFFGEPALNLEDLIQTDGGRGVINILHADRLLRSPAVYSIFLLWLLSELFETLPEEGDLDKPKLVFFFDEAHLLFDGAPKALLDKIEQLVRLIRSKGVGVFFVTQNPLDIPESVLGQLGNRVQHALRAFTPKDQKAVRVAAQTFRQNASLDTERVITELGIGEALVSFLDESGAPRPVERAYILPPAGRIGPLSDGERTALMARSPVAGHYEKSIDRESAYERLAQKAQKAPVPTPAGASPQELPKRRPGRPADSLTEVIVKSTLRSVGSQVGRQIARGILGSILGGRR